MSLADDLEDFFAESDEVIVTEPLQFKAKLGIGERAYGLLRAKEHMATYGGALGAAGTASGIAASGAVASTFFASSGFMAAIGLGAAAVTPIGWVIAAGVLSGGAYAGVSRLLDTSKDNGLIVVPKYINTPLDVIAVALIELMLPVSLKMANAGGEMEQSERTAIHDFFSDEWGYCSGFVTRLIDEYSNQLDAVSYSKLAESLGAYCADSNDCDKEAMMTGFIEHLREIIEADGVVHEQEKEELDYLTSLLIVESEKSGGSLTVTDALTAASEGLSKSTQVASDIASTVGDATAKGFSISTAYVTETGSNTVDKSKQLWRDLSESEQAKSLMASSSEVANKSSEIASAGLESGKQYVSEASETAVLKAKSLWNAFSKNK